MDTVLETMLNETTKRIEQAQAEPAGQGQRTAAAFREPMALGKVGRRDAIKVRRAATPPSPPLSFLETLGGPPCAVSGPQANPCPHVLMHPNLNSTPTHLPLPCPQAKMLELESEIQQEREARLKAEAELISARAAVASRGARA